MQPARTRELWRDSGGRGLALDHLQLWVVCVRRRTAGIAWSIIHRRGVQFQWNRRVVASVSCRSPCGGAAGCGEASVRLLVQGEAGAGVSIGGATQEGAAHPAAVVALHVARHVEGVCPSIPHVGRDRERERGPRETWKSWKVLEECDQGPGKEGRAPRDKTPS